MPWIVSSAVVLQVWSSDQQHQLCPRTCSKCKCPAHPRPSESAGDREGAAVTCFERAFQVLILRHNTLWEPLSWCVKVPLKVAALMYFTLTKMQLTKLLFHPNYHPRCSSLHAFWLRISTLQNFPKEIIRDAQKDLCSRLFIYPASENLEARVKQRVWDGFDKCWHIYVTEHSPAITHPVVDLGQSKPWELSGMLPEGASVVHITGVRVGKWGTFESSFPTWS